MTESSDLEREPAPQEGGGSDARDAAREASGESAQREGQTRGDDRTATGNPAAAGDDSPAHEEADGDAAG
ncbi:MAG TPA: hypothetical protein VNB64_06025 [Solirubrobacteraceae bacterium]|nr:hypothetical protein [Solirubrobacteraceae bacterium]